MPKTGLLRILHSSSSLLVLIAIALASAALLVQQREYRQDVAANDFLGRSSQTTRNGIAGQLDDELQQLGLGRTDGQNLPSSANVSQNHQPSIQFYEIESSLSQYLQESRQVKTEQEGLKPLPADIKEYLTQHPSLPALQRLILENPLPTWELQVAKLIRDPQQTTSFFPIANLQRLLLAQGLSLYEVNPKAAAESFEAAWRLTEAIAARPDLLSQMLSGILQQQQATLLRHIDLPVEQWQARLGRDQQQAILQALSFDSWAEYQTLQYQGQSRHAAESSFPWQDLIGKQYLQFSRLDWLAARKRNQSELGQRQLCDMGTAPEAFPVSPHRLNAFGQGGLTVFAQEWIKASDRMLSAELTQKVMEAKAIARDQGQWPAQLSQLDSQVCPNLAWKYQRLADGGMRLWFSQPPTWRVGISGDFAPLSYEAGALRTDVSNPRAAG